MSKLLRSRYVVLKVQCQRSFARQTLRGSSPREQEIVGIGIPGKCRSSKGKRPFEEEEKACTTSGTEIGAAGSCARAYANCTDAMLFELSGETAGNCAYTLHIDARATRNSGLRRCVKMHRLSSYVSYLTLNPICGTEFFQIFQNL